MLCAYGCGREAMFVSKAGKPRCAPSHNACPALLRKREENYLAKTGYSSPALNPEVRARKRKTCEERFGGPAPVCSGVVKARCEATNLARYGAKNVFSGEPGKARALKGLQTKYGDRVENVSQVPEIRDKVRATFLIRFGTPEVLSAPSIREKIKSTMVQRYGVPWVTQVPMFFRIAQKARWAKTAVFVGDRCFELQGAEYKVLMDLIKMGVAPKDILSDPVDMPILTYFWMGKLRRYYPDFYIPKMHWIVEAKSPYTLKCEWDQNLKKREAVRALGFKFSFMVRRSQKSSSAASVSKPPDSRLNP